MDTGFRTKEYHTKKGTVYHHLICWDDRLQYRTHNSSMQTLYEKNINYEDLYAGTTTRKKNLKFLIPFAAILTVISLSATLYYLFSNTYYPDVFDEAHEGPMFGIIMFILCIASCIVFLMRDASVTIYTSEGEIKIPLDRDEELLEVIPVLFEKRDAYLHSLLQTNPKQLTDLQRKYLSINMQGKRALTLPQLETIINRNNFNLE